jgi:hypothetical protein
MSSPVTVPGDLIPGLLRLGCQIRDAFGDPAVVTGLDERTVAWQTGKSQACARSGIRAVSLDLTTPTGWDAAVAALARKLRPTMASHQRASFFWMGGWCLSDPPGGKGGAMYFDVGVDADQPAEALRRVLHYVAGRS